MSADHRRIIAAYTEAWNAPDPAASRAKLNGVWRADSAYVDPTVLVTGIDNLIEHIFRVQVRRPGSRIVMTSEIEAHHDVLRFNWQRVKADGSLVVAGIDIAIIENGYILRMIGFFDQA
ncbi:MAG: hypothetical protein ABI439_13710 [Rhodospirillales bacterium]